MCVCIYIYIYIYMVGSEVQEESATEFVVGSGASGVHTVQKPNAALS